MAKISFCKKKNSTTVRLNVTKKKIIEELCAERGTVWNSL